MFGFDVVKFLRLLGLLFAAFSINNGYYNSINHKDPIFGYLPDDFKQAALKISCSEHSLNKWLDTLLSKEAIYQKFFPSPLTKTPLIHRENDSFLLIQPGIFFRSSIESIFSQLIRGPEHKTNFTLLGTQFNFGYKCEQKIEAAQKLWRSVAAGTHKKDFPQADDIYKNGELGKIFSRLMT